MTDKQKSLEEKLKVLEVMFLNKLPGKLQEIEQALDAFSSAPDNPSHLELLHRLLHTMAGSAGTFGFDQVGDSARQFDDQLKALKAGALWTTDDVKHFELRVKAYLADSYRVIEMKKVIE